MMLFRWKCSALLWQRKKNPLIIDLISESSLAERTCLPSLREQYLGGVWYCPAPVFLAPRCQTLFSSRNSAPQKRWSWRPTPRFSCNTSIRDIMDYLHRNNLFLELEHSCVPNSTTCSTNFTVELLHGGVRGAELKKWERSGPKQGSSLIVHQKCHPPPFLHEDTCFTSVELQGTTILTGLFHCPQQRSNPKDYFRLELEPKTPNKSSSPN